MSSKEIEDNNIDNLFKENDFIIRRKKKNPKKISSIIRNNHTTWVDKYRPRLLKDIIGHDEVKNVLIKSIETGDLPHLLFYGGSGTGKTSTVLALVMQLYGPKKVNEKVLELNASDENGINVVRDKIIRFANIVVGSGDPKYPSPAFKIIILDEADSMTSEAQTALKKVMESTCDITRFIFICNYESRIIEPIKSRCADFRFNPVPEELMIAKLKKIAKDEGLKVKNNVFNFITEICEGDARRSINTLQNIKYIPDISNRIINKEDIYNITSYMNTKYLDKYWNKIKKCKVNIISKIALEITNTGYPMNYILKTLKDKILSLDNEINQINIAELILHIGKIERKITYGSNNYIQLAAILVHINSIYRGINVNKPEIY